MQAVSSKHTGRQSLGIAVDVASKASLKGKAMLDLQNIVVRVEKQLAVSFSPAVSFEARGAPCGASRLRRRVS